MSDPSPSNSLGLDFDQLKISDSIAEAVPVDHPPTPPAQSPPAPDSAPAREKKKPYVNPERVKTGGTQRDKLSEEALSERMARMREQNEKIKQRRLDVQADEDAFRQTEKAERVKLAQNRKLQENIDRAREQNAKRKMEKIQSREWDSGKPASNWKRPVTLTTPPAESTASIDIKGVIPALPNTTTTTITTPATDSPNQDNSNWTRGGSPRRGRGRGRGGANSSQRDSFNKSTPAGATLSTSDGSAAPATTQPADKVQQQDSARETASQ